MKAKPEQPVGLESQCLVVLGRYAALETLTKAEQADFNGWVDRIGDAPGIEPAMLSGIHGQLIAQGLLRFEFSGRAQWAAVPTESSGEGSAWTRYACGVGGFGQRYARQPRQWGSGGLTSGVTPENSTAPFEKTRVFGGNVWLQTASSGRLDPGGSAL
ncbi:MAG UNVERIFIED_CONTAM: hypothetical protein LVR18_01775 [Planctomycetaceae bacterium]